MWEKNIVKGIPEIWEIVKVNTIDYEVLWQIQTTTWNYVKVMDTIAKEEGILFFDKNRLKDFSIDGSLVSVVSVSEWEKCDRVELSWRKNKQYSHINWNIIYSSAQVKK